MPQTEDQRAIVAKGGGQHSRETVYGAIAELANHKGKMSAKTRKAVAAKLKRMLAN